MEEPETVEHFLVKCSALAGVRQPIMDGIVRCVEGFMQTPIETETLVQILLDSAGVFGDLKDSQVKNAIKDIETLSKRLCYALHTERYKRLNLLPKRKKKSGGKGRRGTQ